MMMHGLANLKFTQNNDLQFSTIVTALSLLALSAEVVISVFRIFFQDALRYNYPTIK